MVVVVDAISCLTVGVRDAPLLEAVPPSKRTTHGNFPVTTDQSDVGGYWSGHGTPWCHTKYRMEVSNDKQKCLQGLRLFRKHVFSDETMGVVGPIRGPATPHAGVLVQTQVIDEYCMLPATELSKRKDGIRFI